MVRAVIMGETRALARGPSGMLIASTPASAHRRALASSDVMSLDFGGTSSTEVAFSPARSFAASRDFLSGGTAYTSASWRISGFTSTWRFTPERDFTARAIVRMCAGVVPQHPPTPRTPSSMYFFAYSVKYSGLVRYITRPLISLGRPAFGMTTIGFDVWGMHAWRASKVPEGPVPQLIPTMSTFASASRAEAMASARVR